MPNDEVKASLGDSMPTTSLTPQIAQAVAIGALGAIPVGGPLLQELLGTLANVTESRQKERWLLQLARVVDTLRERVGRSPQQVGEDPDFYEAVIVASRIGMATAREDKRRMVANALLEGGSWSSIDAPMRRLLFRLLDELEPEHYALLAFLSDPTLWLSRHPHVNPDGDLAAVVHEIVGSAEPEILGDRYIRELYAQGLINVGYSVGAPISSIMEVPSVSSSIGQALLKMVLDSERAPSF